MGETIAVIVAFFIGLISGIGWHSSYYYDKCVKANQNVSVGQIQEFCNERLYRK